MRPVDDPDMSLPGATAKIHEDVEATADWVRFHGGACTPLPRVQSEGFWVETVSGRVQVGYGDWVIRNDRGEFGVFR